MTSVFWRLRSTNLDTRSVSPIEQNRPDAPGECPAAPQGPNGTLLLTPYDPHSVMNYCNAQYNNNGKLSQYDTEAVQNVVRSIAWGRFCAMKEDGVES